MEIDRPHFRTTSTNSCAAAATTSELFICFTSRLSSSSMKLSKSILSPGRAARDGGPVTLSSSLSRRLRTNGSLKGGQASPFFNTTGKKRGCAFENPEPSSPKVTCIGQVRVKTKKKVKQSRSLSKRRSGGEVSFRKIEPQTCADGEDKVCGQKSSNSGAHFQPPPPQECLPRRNQRWVHFPISICETLRSVGAEFSCLFPCRSSCLSTSEREKSEKQNGDDDNGCGAVFARWLVSMNDGEGGKRREIELVVGGGDEEEGEEERVSMRSSRRHVFEDFEVKDDKIGLKGRSLEREDEAARVSICIPPKNALLLMRCRSDPMKMAALVNNRFTWNPNENEDIQESMDDGKDEAFDQKEVDGSGDTNEEKDELEIEGVGEEIEEKTEAVMLVVEDGGGENDEEEVESNMSSFEALLDQENAEHYEDCCPIEDEEEDDEISPFHHLFSSPESNEEALQTNEAAALDCNIEQKDSVEERRQAEEEEKVAAAEENQELETSNEDEEKKEKEGPLLPECLLLMMCEPKLSMEVSKETWVCRTDFMRWLPERPRKAAKAAKPGGVYDHDPTRRLSIDSKPKPITDKSDLQQPPRSSCSLPPGAAAATMATMIEQKLVNAVGYEPFVLTRCKSEPMRTAAAKLMPESCFWRNAVRKLEPHRCDTMGVGAAGVGF